MAGPGKVWTDGTTEGNEATLNKLVSTISNTLNVAIAACRVTGNTTTPAVTNIAGFSTTCTRSDTGWYTLAFSSAFNAIPAVVAAGSIGTAPAICSPFNVLTTGCDIKIAEHDGTATDGDCKIIVVGDRS